MTDSDWLESGLTPRQEELLDEIAAGERSPDDPATREAARDPRFAAALAQLRGALSLLRRERGHLREALAGDAREDDLQLARRSLLAAAAAEPMAQNGVTREGRGPLARALPWIAAAAAVLFLALWLLDRSGGSGDPSGQGQGMQSLDGQGGLEFEAEAIEVGKELSWTPSERDSVTGYRVVVTDVDGVPLWESTVLAEAKWVAAADVVAAWPDRVRVRVLALDDGLRTVEACPFVVMPVVR